MKTDGLLEGVELAVVIVRQSLIKLSGERWTRVREEDRGRFLKYLKPLRLYYIMFQLRMQLLTGHVKLGPDSCFLRKNGFQRCLVMCK